MMSCVSASAINQTELNKQVIRRFIDEVVYTGNVALLAEPVSPDCVETDGKVRIVSGVTGKIVEHGGAANMLEPFLAAGMTKANGRKKHDKLSS